MHVLNLNSTRVFKAGPSLNYILVYNDTANKSTLSAKTNNKAKVRTY